ncbi:hypothetical protein ASD30_19555 [Nocardioides sp. Root140]|nr:hypothetical protein ASD30_19555 [Nocardioides sp. Root140]
MTRGALTILPIWSTTSARPRYTFDATKLHVAEADNPVVSQLMIGNVGDRPALVMEGLLFEGGLQHRMATRSMMVGVHQRIPLPVACVEQGRWGGASQQSTRGRRATPYIRESVRRPAGHDVQGEVWSRVAERTHGHHNPTSSFVRRLDVADARRVDWSDVKPLEGQCGVLLAIGGQPCVAEVFESSMVLHGQWRSILEAAALDAQVAPAVLTPGRRARRFLERIEALELRDNGSAGIGDEAVALDDKVSVTALRWHDRDVHTRMTNLRHPMLVA